MNPIVSAAALFGNNNNYCSPMDMSLGDHCEMDTQSSVDCTVSKSKYNNEKLDFEGPVCLDLIQFATKCAGLIKKPNLLRSKKLDQIRVYFSKITDLDLVIKMKIYGPMAFRNYHNYDILKSAIPALKRKKVQAKELLLEDIETLKTLVDNLLFKLSFFKTRNIEGVKELNNMLTQGASPEWVNRQKQQYEYIDFLVNIIGESLIKVLILMNDYINKVYSAKKYKSIVEKLQFNRTVYLLFIPNITLEKNGWLNEANRQKLGLLNIEIIKNALFSDGYVRSALGVNTKSMDFIKRNASRRLVPGASPVTHTSAFSVSTLFHLGEIFCKNFKKIIKENLLKMFNYNSIEYRRQFSKFNSLLKEKLGFIFYKIKDKLQLKPTEYFHKLFNFVENFNLPLMKGGVLC